MKSSIRKRSVVIGGHKTSVSLEDAFWSDFKEIAQNQRATLSQLVETIDGGREQSNLSSAIRLYVLGHFQSKCKQAAEPVIQYTGLNGESVHALER